MSIKDTLTWNDIERLIKQPDGEMAWDELLDAIADYRATVMVDSVKAIVEAVKAEREACAKIAEQEYIKHGISALASFGSEGYGWNRGAAAIAKAIRVRDITANET